MTVRLNLLEHAPEAYQAMQAIEKYLRGSTLPSRVLELVKLRASQINGCAFCVDMHSHDAKAAGETDERLFTVAAWRDAPFFTADERAALALTEEATRLGTDGVSDRVWDEAAAHFDESQLAALVVAIATINAWNRYSISVRMPAGLYRRTANA